MASAVASDSQDSPQARLSLHVDAPPNSSPFPSPSSSFLPPPMPGAHEFAVKPPPAGKGKRGSNVALNSAGDGTAKEESSGAMAVSPVTPTPTNNRANFLSPAENHPSIPEGSSTSALNSPMTPTAAITSNPLSPDPTASQPPGDSATIVNRLSSTQTSYSNHSRTSTRDSNPCSDSTSLTSTRPAPPSPAISRRASAAPSTTSNRSRSSRPTSQAISRNPSMRKSTQLSQSHNSPQKKRRSLLVKIKDFAFASTDDRHAGLGSDVPKPNRPVVLNRFHRSKSSSNRLSIASVSTTSSDIDGEEDEGMEEDGWGGFKLGFGRFSWGFGRGATGTGTIGRESRRSGESGFPSKTDFARNFADDADDDFSYDEPESYGNADEEERPDESDGEEEPLYPGLYRALYAFEPEGTAEMKLEEDQIVRVIGRGGGVGWAVVLKEGPEDKTDSGESKGHALVPESYLEVVGLDEEEDADVADG